MNRLFLMTALASGLLALTAVAQEADTPAHEPANSESMPGRGMMAMPDFATFDADGDGLVTADEITAFLTRQIEARVERMVARLDSDGDGAISPEEFDIAQERMQHYRHRSMTGDDSARRPQGRNDERGGEIRHGYGDRGEHGRWGWHWPGHWMGGHHNSGTRGWNSDEDAGDD